MAYKRIESDDELKRRVALAKVVLAGFDEHPDWDPPRDPKVRARIAWSVAGAQLSAERARIAEGERQERQRAHLLAEGEREIDRLARGER